MEVTLILLQLDYLDKNSFPRNAGNEKWHYLLTASAFRTNRNYDNCNGYCTQCEFILEELGSVQRKFEILVISHLHSIINRKMLSLQHRGYRDRGSITKNFTFQHAERFTGHTMKEKGKEGKLSYHILNILSP